MEKTIRFAGFSLLLALLLTGCGYAGPENAVKQEMDLIRQLDESTIKAFVSYEDIKFANSSAPEIGPETTEAVKLFFQNFKYRIRSSSVNEENTAATVEMTITNVDAKALAKDLCRSIIEKAVTQSPESQPEGLTFSFSVMKKCLEENEYPLVSTPATVHLVNQNGNWVIPESPEFEDQLTGGLVSCLQDPYLLSPEEVLEYNLDPFLAFDAEMWKSYLTLNDVFNTGSDLAPELDTALAHQIAAFFQYEILGVTQDGNSASAQLAITSLDLENVMNHCRQALLEYAKTTESIRATDAEIAQKTAEFLLEALQSETQSVQNTVTVTLVNNGYTWELRLDEAFADALLGGIDTAMETLYSSEAS